MMNPVIWLISEIITLYSWVLGLYILLNWLIAFNIINRYQPLVSKLLTILGRMVEPALARIRRYLPDFGGIDISPIILILGLQFILRAVYYYA
jgi:YggT family protein